jgi:hypothetical protein
VIYIKYEQDYQIKEDEMEWEFSVHGSRKTGREVGVNGRIILK